MGKLIDIATSHFSAQAIRTLEVPEWETTIYSKNLSLEDKAKFLSRADGDSTDYMIYSIILGCSNETGDPVFGLEDKVKLRRHVDPEVLSRVANFVLKIGAHSEEEREKN